jgi:DNA topoisomerase-2
MNKIEVTLDADENTIRVWNNGSGIPIAIHQEYNIYVPELIFGNLLTGILEVNFLTLALSFIVECNVGSNFDDEQEKTTGGRNGYGGNRECLTLSTTIYVMSNEFI